LTLYSSLFGDPDVAAHFSDRALLQAMLDVETALAEAEASVGVVPARSVDPIRTAARVERYDPDAIARDSAGAGNAVIPLVRELTRQVAAIDEEASRFVHLGATSQDIIDTALVLQLRGAVPLLVAHIRRAERAAARHARSHRSTPIAGRTWMQQATPTTFGLKAAGWLEALERGRASIDQRASEAFVLQFGGASGTLAALGPAARRVATALGDRLSLVVPDLPWHAHRDRIVRLACALGVLIGTLGKIATDLGLLAQTEVAEAFERSADGKGGSSSMPHKRNPVSAAVALAASVRAPGLVASLLGGMPQQHERGLGGWQAEWEVVPELVILAAGAARSMADALDHLVVDVERMARNLELTGGVTQSESVVSALAPHLGRPAAYKLVEAACVRALAEGVPLATVLTEDPSVPRVLSRDAIEKCLAPRLNFGDAEAMVDRVLAGWERRGGGHA
jgi:3-carboxy-cis,cis-muconate cycloisomerase